MTPTSILARTMAQTKYWPRQRRDMERAERAAEQARERGLEAIDCALAAVTARFNTAARINTRKMRVDRALKRGPHSEAIRCFYSWLTRLLIEHHPRIRTLNDCLDFVRAERLRAYELERAIGRSLHVKHDALSEAEIALRWLRRHDPLIDVRGMLEAMSRGPDRYPTIFVAAE